MCWRRWCVLISSANGCPRSFRVDLRLTEKLLFSGFTVISGMLGEQQGGSLGWRGEPCHLRESEEAERGPPLLATPTQPAVPRFWSTEFHKFSCYPWPILLYHWFFHPLALPWVFFPQWISFDTTLKEMCLVFGFSPLFQTNFQFPCVPPFVLTFFCHPSTILSLLNILDWRHVYLNEHDL